MWSGDFPRQIMGHSRNRRIKPFLRTLNTSVSFTVILDFSCGDAPVQERVTGNCCNQRLQQLPETVIDEMAMASSRQAATEISGFDAGTTSPTSSAETPPATSACCNASAPSAATAISNPPAVCGSNRSVLTSSLIPAS